MDDTQRLVAEFPIGDTTVTIKEPTGAQLLVLGLSRTPKAGDGQELTRLIRRMFRILESLMGNDAWDGVVESGVVDETLTERDLVDLVEAVVRFPWARHRAERDAPRNIEDEPPAVTDTAAPRAPRLVSGA